MRTNILVTLLLFAISIPAYDAKADRGGTERGNGGDVIVCRGPNGAIKSAELLDFYEARVLRDIYYNLGDAALSVREKYVLALQRLDAISPLRAAKYLEQADAFLQEAKFLPDANLVDVPDSDHVAVPVNCEVKQLVIQQKPQFPEDKRYIVDLTLWNLLDNANKAGAILHEVIYREALEYEHSNSIQARYFNSYICADKLGTYDSQTFIKFMQSIKFGKAEIYKICIFLGDDDYDLKFHDNGKLSRARVCSSEVTVGQYSFYVRKNHAIVHFDKNGLIETINAFDGSANLITRYTDSISLSEVSFFPNGSLKSVSAIQTKIETPYAKIIGYGRVEFYESGWPAIADFGGGSTGQLFTQLGALDISGGKIAFWPSGIYKKGAKTWKAMTFGGKEGFFANHTFYENGNWESGDFKFSYSSSGNLKLKVGAKTVTFSEGHFEFHMNGALKQGILASATTLPLANGGEKRFRANSRLNFDEQGRVIE